MLGWVLAVLGVVAAGGLGLLAQSERATRRRHETELEEAREALRAERAELTKRSRSFEERGKELVELRRRLDKTRRRAFDARTSSGSLEGRIAELEQALEVREERAREAARALEAARETLAARDRELERVRTQLAEAEERPTLAEEEARRHKALEAELGDLTQKLRDAERETARFRSRERTHRRLYLVIKGELEAARDRLAALGSPLALHPEVEREVAAEDATEGDSEGGSG